MSGNWVIDSGISLATYGSPIATSSSDVHQLLVEGDTIRVAISRTPAHANSTGYSGEICWDENNLYIHIGTEWKKIPLSSIT